ncbi:MAG: alpha/beta fold hydrolase [Pseudomonadota bacterium]
MIERRPPFDLAELQFPPFRARLPWLTGDLQTIRNTAVGGLRSLASELDRLAAEKLTIDLSGGDKLVATLNRPATAADRPLAILIHGLTGCEDSPYVRVSALGLLAKGFPVLRLNLRGAGLSQPLCRGLYHAGRTEDLAAVMTALPDGMARHGVVAVGYSLGGNMLLKYLGERGADAGLSAAVTVSAPIDLSATERCMARRRNLPYHRYVLSRMQREALAPPSDLSEDQKTRVRRASSVYEFDDWFVAPRNGFGTANRYYEICSSKAYLAGVRVPTLIIHGSDDPWIPAEMYRVPDWRNLPFLRLLMAPGGGHVGFHGTGDRMPWHDRCLQLFFDAVQTSKRAASTAA